MVGVTCCVVECKNNSAKSNCKFYRFPVAKHKLEQKRKWISAVRRVNSDGSTWSPASHDVICSVHFVGNKKSVEVTSPSYIPSIFPAVYKVRKVNESAAKSRHDRFIRRKYLKKELLTKEAQISLNEQMEVVTNDFVNDMVENEVEQKYIDQQCQVNIELEESKIDSNTFVCNMYIYSDVSEVAIQTEIADKLNCECQAKCTSVKTPVKKFKNKKCGTPQKTFVDQAVGLDSEYTEYTQIGNNKNKHFIGFESIKNDDQLIDLSGTSLENFNFLLKRMDYPEKCKISNENRLLIFLMKMKTNLTFSALSVLFDVHRTTVSRIFFATLHHLACATANLVFWPDKDSVQGTMPDSFRPQYNQTRVIIDCTEFRIDVPASVENRVYCYSHYKKCFTAKLLVGITPSGFISFKSKVAGGRKSDSQMTIESGLIDLLEDGDVVLADKGFPDIRKSIDQSGKDVLLVMPPFLEKNSEFTKKETEDTYSIARVRIHVERIMQRLRTYQVLNKIPEYLFNHIDDIVHVCCVLVNLQPPIISDQMKGDKSK